MNKAINTLQRTLLATLGGLPLIVVSWVLIAVWLDPSQALGGGWLKAASSLIFLEFLLLHSGAFMAVGPVLSERRWIRLCWFLGFGAIYALVIVMYVGWAANDSVFWLLISVLIARLFTLVILRDKAGVILMLQRSAIGMIMLLVTALILFIPLPELGITETVRYSTFGPVADMLSEYPQRTLAWGMVYFLIMGFIEIYAGWKLPDWTEAEIDKGWEQLKR